MMCVERMGPGRNVIISIKLHSLEILGMSQKCPDLDLNLVISTASKRVTVEVNMLSRTIKRMCCTQQILIVNVLKMVGKLGAFRECEI
jgi:hypothetical protein